MKLVDRWDSDEPSFETLYVIKNLAEEESVWKRIVSRLRKHQEGKHDQSTHGRKGGFNVPNYVDIEGKRFSKEAIAEFVSRKSAFDEAAETKFQEIKNEASMAIYGKPLSELSEFDARRLGNENAFKKVDGKWVERKWAETDADWDSKKGKTARQLTNEDPEVKPLKEKLDDHYLIKDAMNQPAWNPDGTLGPDTIGDRARMGESHNEFVGRMLQINRSGYDTDDSDYSKPTNVIKRDANGNVIRNANGYAESEATLVSREAAEKIHAEEWKAFGDAAYPEVIVSNKGLRSILANGEFKTYTQVDRPARAGANDAEYKNARAAYESVAFGYDNAEDTTNRPVSGLLTAFDPHQDILKGYGGTQVILKPSVLARSTVTPDDSLNSSFSPQTVPAFLAKPSKPYSNKTVASDVQVNGKGYYTNRNRGIYNTPEIQIHGGVRVSDIASVVFRDTVPAQLATKLDGLGIPYEVKTIEDAN